MGRKNMSCLSREFQMLYAYVTLELHAINDVCHCGRKVFARNGGNRSQA